MLLYVKVLVDEPLFTVCTADHFKLIKTVSLVPFLSETAPGDSKNSD